MPISFLLQNGHDSPFFRLYQSSVLPEFHLNMEIRPILLGNSADPLQLLLLVLFLLLDYSLTFQVK